LAIFLKQRFAGCRITALHNLHRRGLKLNLPRFRQAYDLTAAEIELVSEPARHSS
jgi:hypothetical protein